MRRPAAIALGWLLLSACPPQATPGGGPQGPESGSGGAPATGERGGPSDGDHGAPDGPSATSGAEGARTTGADERGGTTSTGDRPEPAATGSFDEALESIPRGRPDREKPGLAGARGCEGGARAVGERWKVECNTCTCEASGEVTCTLMACLPLR